MSLYYAGRFTRRYEFDRKRLHEIRERLCLNYQDAKAREMIKQLNEEKRKRQESMYYNNNTNEENNSNNE